MHYGFPFTCELFFIFPLPLECVVQTIQLYIFSEQGIDKESFVMFADKRAWSWWSQTSRFQDWYWIGGKEKGMQNG